MPVPVGRRGSMSYTYNKHAILLIAGIMRLPIRVKWLVFLAINLAGLVRIIFIYRKAWKQAEKGKDWRWPSLS